MRHTEDPPTLITATLATIEHIARREGLGELTECELDFIWDLLAKTGGAEVKPFDEITAQAEATVHALTEAHAFIKHNGDPHGYGHVVSLFEQDYCQHLEQQYMVLEQLDLNEIPGYNHPTKAVRVVKLFRNAQRIWIMFCMDMLLINLVNQIEAALDRIEGLSPAGLDILKAFSDGDNPEEDAQMLGLELELNNIQLEEVLRICRQLDQLSEFGSPHADPTPDPNGEEVRLRDIEDLSELGRAAQSSYALPPRIRLKDAVLGETDVREPLTRRDKKQLLYMVVDGTASMTEDQFLAASRACGVVINRLQAVIEGDAELYLRFFDSVLSETEHHADSSESARELMRIVSNPLSYLGGSTVFREPLDTATQRVQELMGSQGFYNPELIFITDGQADVPALSVLHGVKMHTIQVGITENEELSQLARQSGGLGLYAGITFGEDL